MKLIIVESPVKAQALQTMLGSDVMVRATKGHVKDLPARSLGVSIDKNYRPGFRTRSTFRDELRAIRSEAGLCSEILLATDPDREGELIADDLAGMLKKLHAPVRRVLLSDLTVASVSAALRQPGPIDSKRASAQRVRRVIDRLIGYRTSRFLSQALGSAKPQGAGRVQSSILVYLADATSTHTRAGITPSEVRFAVHLSGTDSRTVAGRYVGGALSDSSRGITGTFPSDQEPLRIADLSRQHVDVPAPAAHTTAAFLSAAAADGLMNASDAMRAAQRLYEAAYRDAGFAEGLISYPRTDSFVLPAPDRECIRAVILDLAGPEYVGQSEKKGSRGAHGGLRPTDPGLLPGQLRGKLDTEAYRAYAEIWSAAVASEMASARIERMECRLESLHGAARGRVSFSRLVFDGFMSLARLPGATLTAAALTPCDDEAPDLTVGTVLRCCGSVADHSKPGDPDSIRESEAILELERRGFGRPGTYADALQKLIDRRYLTRRTGYLTLTPAGKRVAYHLSRYLRDLVSGSMTTDLERLIEDVASGKRTANTAVAEFDQQLLKPAIEKARLLLAVDRSARIHQTKRT